MFTVPPLGSFSLPALYDWHYHNSPDHPLFVFKDAPGLRTICWKEAIQGMHRASKRVAASIGDRASNRRPVIAVIASSDTITYFCFIVGVMRLGWTVFPMSPRNSPPTIVSLLKQVGATHIFMSNDQAIQSIVGASLDLLPQDYAVESQEMPSFLDLFPQHGSDPLFIFNAIPELDMKLPALILHSSGTTSTPKAITWTQLALARGASVPTYGDLGLTGMVVACHTIPMFHAMGAIQLMAAPSRGVIMSMFTPQCPAIVPDPVNVLSIALATKSDYILCVPAFLETWSSDPQIVEELVKLKGLIWGGAILAKTVGDLLTARGVNLHIVYGSTEAGLLSRYLSRLPGKDWEYFSFTPNRQIEFFPDSRGICEAVAISNSEYTPCVVNTTFEGRDAYLLSDLFTRHPTKSYLWKILGRTDDQIVLSTGEKANPIPLEGILASDPHVQASIFVGHSRIQLGVIVEPKPAFQFDTSDLNRVIAFRNLIWPTVERMNEFAPSYARIYKEMILVASPTKPFSYTFKNVARRQEAAGAYEQEIDSMYRAAEESSQAEIGAPNDWSPQSVLAFTRRVVNATLKRPISDDVDLFSHGGDSLNATWIRNSLLRALRNQHVHIARELPTNFVYSHPSITSLSTFIARSVSMEFSSDASDHRKRADSDQWLQELVDRYTKNLPIGTPCVSRTSASSGDIILLTGSTGTFGCVILAHLLESQEVARVYALGRKFTTKEGGDSLSLFDRHVQAFRTAGLNVNLLASEKLTVVESDLSVLDFDVDSGLLQIIRSSITHIIHSAWNIDFNLTVESFEPYLSGLRNLVEFALSCSGPSQYSPKFIFISSVGSVRSSPSPVLEKSFSSPAFALGSGYTESKWAAERFLEIISQSASLQTIVVRPVQLTGGPSGAWKEDEWFPSLVKSSVALGYLPESQGSVSWLPTSDAASAILELRKIDHSQTFHIAHPHPISWSKLVSYLSDIMDIPVTSYPNWLSMLETAHKQLSSDANRPDQLRNYLRANPALRIIDVFRAYASQTEDPSREPLGTPQLSCQNTLSISPALRNSSLTPIDRSDVEKWLDFWYSSGFLKKGKVRT